MNVHAKLPESDELPTDLRARVAIKVGDNISTDEILPTGARGCGLRKTPGTQAPGRPHAQGPALLTDQRRRSGTSYQAAVMSCAVARARWAAARAMLCDRPVSPAGSRRRSMAAASRWAVTRGSRLRASANVVPSARAAS